MDPNETLKEIRELIADSDRWGLHERKALIFQKLVGELDGYLSGGGRLPDDWQVKREKEDPIGVSARLLEWKRRAWAWLLAVLLAASNAVAAAPPVPPRVFLDTTPVAPTQATISVAAGGSLQAALDAVSPGGVVELAAGATFTGNFVVRARATTPSLWITVRASSPSLLPPRGTRVTPLNAPAMAKIISPNTAPALTFENGSKFYRLTGLEITTTHAVTTATNYGLVFMGTSATTVSQLPTDITFDRCYIHGTPTGNVRRGIAMNSARTAVVDSHLSDFHEVGQDSQAIMSWNGTGPFAIVNNYLEGAGENVMFGGADPAIANLVPSDIEVRGNLFAKPLKWKVGDPAYAGIHWSVKNIFELKNARYVLVTGNTLERNWADAQNGFAILFTPRNQNGGAAWTIVADVRFENNVVRSSTNGFNVLGTDNLQPSQQTARVLVRQNLLYDIDGPRWGGGDGTFVQVVDGVADLVVEHNTALQSGRVLFMDGATNSGFEFRDNITPHNTYGIYGSSYGYGNGAIAHYFPGTTLRKNVIAGPWPTAGGATVSAYSNHPDNFFPAGVAAIGFVDAAANDYRLSATSPYRGAATDGTDVGYSYGAAVPIPTPTLPH